MNSLQIEITLILLSLGISFLLMVLLVIKPWNNKSWRGWT